MSESLTLHNRIEKILNTIKSGLYEKDEAMRLSLLTALAGESIFLLGAPGSAKSMIARRITQAFKIENGNENSLKYFEYLMNRYSTPEDLFGPYSIKALTGEKTPENPEGKESHLRLTKGYLPEADIAFLDEIWKASPAIQNTLLTIINEKKFHNGSKVENVPLKALFAASNELPEANKGLEALYDRFILRLIVDYIQDEDQFFEMVDQSSSSDFTIPEDVKNILITNDDLKNWKKEIDKVTLSDEAKSVISTIRKELVRLNNEMSEEDKNKDEQFLVGDRRWKKIVHILKTSAYFNSRNEVDLMDCSLIEYCIWNTEKQQKKSHEIVENAIKENGLASDFSIEDINEQIEDYKNIVIEEWFDEEVENRKKVFVLKPLSDIAHKTKQELFDKEYYIPLLNIINKEIKNLNEKQSKDIEPFKQNLFANQEYCNIITSRIIESKKLLEDAIVTIDKEKAKYYKENLTPHITAGDAVLSDNRIVTQDEIEKLSDEDKKKIIGIVCIDSNANYIISTTETNTEWKNIEYYANTFGHNFPEYYKTGWQAPSASLFDEINENKDIINESLGYLSSEIEESKYWSSTEHEKNKTAAKYYDFSEDGYLEYTTKDHKFNVRLIHKCSL